MRESDKRGYPVRDPKRLSDGGRGETRDKSRHGSVSREDMWPAYSKDAAGGRRADTGDISGR